MVSASFEVTDEVHTGGVFLFRLRVSLRRILHMCEVRPSYVVAVQTRAQDAIMINCSKSSCINCGRISFIKSCSRHLSDHSLWLHKHVRRMSF